MSWLRCRSSEGRIKPLGDARFLPGVYLASMAGSVSLFLGGAGTVVEALADPRVGRAWDQPSVLEEQTVGGLAGHLARGGVWVVASYLDGDAPGGPADFESAAEYFASFANAAQAEDHRAVRARGAAVAAAGWQAVRDELQARLDAMTAQVTSLPSDRLVSVIGGKVMRLDDYLETRIVEQAVHLDDLARSIGADPWALPDGHESVALGVGVEIARLRRGTPAVLRALYRRGFADVALPAL